MGSPPPPPSHTCGLQAVRRVLVSALLDKSVAEHRTLLARQRLAARALMPELRPGPLPPVPEPVLRALQPQRFFQRHILLIQRHTELFIVSPELPGGLERMPDPFPGMRVLHRSCGFRVLTGNARNVRGERLRMMTVW